MRHYNIHVPNMICQKISSLTVPSYKLFVGYGLPYVLHKCFLKFDRREIFIHVRV